MMILTYARIIFLVLKAFHPKTSKIMVKINDHIQITAPALASSKIPNQQSNSSLTRLDIGSLHNSRQRSNNESESKKGFFVNILDTIKQLLGFKTAKSNIINNSTQSNLGFIPNVEIFNQIISKDFIEQNADKYIFVLSGNVRGTTSRYGQSALLSMVKKTVPESVVELPVQIEHAAILDDQHLKKVAFKEESIEVVQDNIERITQALDQAIEKARLSGKTIALLKGGYGTGASRMYFYSPKTFQAMNKLFEDKFGVKMWYDPKSSCYQLSFAKEVNSSPKPNNRTKGFDTETLRNDLWNNIWSIAPQLTSN
jgi:hypothetical protein